MIGKGRKKDKSDSGSLRWMSAGIEFCGVIAIFCYIGYRLDQYFDTLPLMLMLCFFIAFVGMTYLFYKDSR